jgi:large exoprotein involved in heme utilization and adhesion
MQDKGRITVDSAGRGRGGNIQLTANRLDLDRATIFAETASTQGGNIQIQARDLLLLRRNSFISTTAGTAQAGGDGGNITINAGFIVGVLSENSDIRANAFTGNGGRVNITAQGIYGLKFQPKDTPTSDITASSQFGISGTVTLNTLNLDPNRGLVQLSADLVDPANQISQGCAATGRQSSNRFVVTGRGGLSPDPTEALNQTAVWREPGSGGQKPIQNLKFKTQNSIVEAMGWVRTADGTIALVSDAAAEPTFTTVLTCQTDRAEGN